MSKQKIIFMMIPILFFACAKKRPYEEVFKDDKVAKITQNFDKTATYLYVPTTTLTPREVGDARPFYQGDAKLVKMVMTEKGVELRQIESDGRFKKNPLNDTPVLFIPGEYSDYRCKEDSNGRCTNKEEENDEITWDKKAYFRPDFDKTVVRETNFLDLVDVEASSCFTKVSQEAIHSEMVKGIINIEVERTYRVSPSSICAVYLYYSDKLDYGSFKVRYFYSAIDINKITDPKYPIVQYPEADFDRYGMFKTEKMKLNDEYDGAREIKLVKMNRWSPNRKEVVYYLSKNFSSDEAAKSSSSFDTELTNLLREQTFKSIEVLNQGLKEANTPFVIKLKEWPKDDRNMPRPGDLRLSMINLIDEPLANGLLGYGPSVVNPDTGEIIRAHNNMYAGVLRQTVRRVYEGMIDLTPVKKSLDLMNKFKLASAMESSLHAHHKHTGPHAHAHAHHLGHQNISKKVQDRLVKRDHKSRTLSKIDRKVIADNMKEYWSEDKAEAAKEIQDKEARLESYSRNNAYAQEFLNTAQAAKALIPGISKRKDFFHPSTRKLKFWNELTSEQKKDVIRIVLPHVYHTVFLHEMGHNLGLRHNFMGSFDKENFYTQKESEKKGMPKAPAYSSVMDYNLSELNFLTVLGKYDLGTLRFAYAREVEVQEVDPSSSKVLKTTWQKVPSTLVEMTKGKAFKEGSKQLKSYMFCTDENAGTSLSCNRFDEGTSYEEIVEQAILNHRLAYRQRNFRNDRRSFSTYEDINYASSRHREFSRLRMSQEVAEIIYSFFGERNKQIPMSNIIGAVEQQICSGDDAPDYCKTFLAPVQKAAKYFLEILKTPDHTCVVQKEGEEEVTTERLADVYNLELSSTQGPVTKSCFDPRVEAHFATKQMKVLAQGGKFLNNIRGNGPFLKYSSDISVRGFWIDKLMALNFLTERFSMTTSQEKLSASMLDLPSIREEFDDFMSHLLSGSELKSPVPFYKKDGTAIKFNYTLDFQEIIPNSPSRGVNNFFGLPGLEDFSLTKSVMGLFTRNYSSVDPAFKSYSKSYYDALIPYKVNAFTNLFDGEWIAHRVGTFGVLAENKKDNLSYKMIESFKALKMLNALSVNDERSKSMATEIATLKTDMLAAEDAPEAYKAALKFSGLGRIIVEVSINTLKENPEITKKQVVTTYGASTAEILWPVIELGREVLEGELKKSEELIAKRLEELGASATEAYALSADVLKDFASGQLSTKTERYTNVFNLLYE